MADTETSDTSVASGILSDLLRHLMVLAFCGTFSFVTGVETLRALENGTFVTGDWLTPAASAVFGLIALQSIVRIFPLSQKGFKQLCAKEFALYAADPSILSGVLFRPPSKVSGPMLIVVTALIGGVVAGILHFATMRGETTANISQVCTAAGVTMLSLYGVVVLWSRGIRMGAIVLGTGAIAVTLFWAAVLASVAFDHLNFDNADPMELAAVSLAILFGGIVLAGTWAMITIHGQLKRHKLRNDTDERSVDDLAK